MAIRLRNVEFLASIGRGQQAVGLDPRVIDWAARVVINGGAAPSTATKNALNTFILGLDADGTTSKFLCLNTFAPDNLIASITPLLVGVGSDPWTNINFTSGRLSINGLTGDGASMYLDTGVLDTSFANSATGAAIYDYTGSTDTTVDYGVVGGATAHLLGRAGVSSGYYFRNGNPASNNINSTSPGPGFYLDNRTSSTDHRVYFANSGNAFAQLGATDSTTDSLPFATATSSIVFGYRFNGPQALSPITMSFHALFTNFTSTNGSNLYSRVQAVRTEFGGGFV